MNFDQWLTDVNGRVIGAGECWDLAEDYDKRVVNGPMLVTTKNTAHPFYAIGVWDGYGVNGVEAAYSQAGAQSTALPGWLAIWKWGGPNTPFSHIAPVVQDKGGSLYCMTQNPGPAHFDTITKAGLAGYLVPKNGGTASNVQLASDNTNSGSNPLGLAGDTVNALSGLASAYANFSRFINTPGIWQRIGVYLLGGFIVTAAVVYYFKDEAVSAIEGVVK